ncbi:hypothetical protein [Peribacillus deserti]|uniref:Uncharacterized protein n=1 Tax=Peribacillus deserti TaxID=673318 RepID=A0A2N5LZQ1_9BACI|nr:hypothetical protein [Peribacillus deserti]PLT27597.1 hypothetical protein CUU66_23065 [Peribacillus deserti]
MEAISYHFKEGWRVLFFLVSKLTQTVWQGRSCKTIKLGVIDSGFGPEDGTTGTTEYVGRAVVALASDTTVSEFSGDTIMVAELARKYRFTDGDGTQPLPFD